ncbi:MAG TPA: hypothetical protein VKG05_08540 [Steroidobacteraceae bacterium]|nr:hypothetical protein [Steroidobacteraceae bacterium]
MKAAQFVFAPIVLAATIGGCGNPKDIDVDIQAPPLVKMGEEFIITATIDNHATGAQKLVSLDIGDAYLDGIAITAFEPNYKDTMHVPIDNTRSYIFDLPVETGRPLRILLHARAVKTGDHNSQIDFCINSNASFLSRTLRTTVE